MIDSLSVKINNVHDALIVIKAIGKDLVEIVDEVNDDEFISVNKLKQLLHSADCLNGWVNELAILFLNDGKEDKDD